MTKALVVYDSVYGNTEKIARTIAEAIGREAKVLRVNEVNLAELDAIELLIVGSPTHGGGPTPATKDFLNKLTGPVIKDTKIAAFDTRLSWLWVKIFGFAAEKISNILKAKGGIIIASPQGFLVTGKESSIKEGELERAAEWARAIARKHLLDASEKEQK